jgi:DNA replication licensing factor MCM7
LPFPFPALQVGSFVSVRGIVTRVTDVAPQIRVAAYLCSVCGYESYQSVNNRDYIPLQLCPSPACKKNETKGRLTSQVRGSKFVRFQSVRLQEMHTEVPVGHIPRTTTVRVFGDLTRIMRPGDLVTVSGIFLVAPYHGFRAVRAGLTTDTFIEAMHIVPSKKSYDKTAAEQDPTMAAKIAEESKDPKIYERLAASIAPEIFGHEDIKRALMLLLVVSTRDMRSRCARPLCNFFLDATMLIRTPGSNPRRQSFFVICNFKSL